MVGSVEAVTADTFFFVELVWESIKEGFLWEGGMEGGVENCVMLCFFEKAFAGFDRF